MTLFGWFYWNPDRTLFTLPVIDRPVVWYGLWFVLGFIVGYLILVQMFQRKLKQTPRIQDRDIASWPILIEQLQSVAGESIFQKLDRNTRQALKRDSPVNQAPTQAVQTGILNALNDSLLDREQLCRMLPKAIRSYRDNALFLVDRLTWLFVAGTIIGARLGHVLFYDWTFYRNHPGEIVKVWEGGLASHGAGVGIFLALYIYQRMIRKQFPEMGFVTLLDMIAVPAAFGGCCIRIGNFFNQEIIGIPTTVPWAVVFGDPVDGSSKVPRHPTQLYEAISYLFIFIILAFLWKRFGEKLRTGMMSGLFFILVFTSRFLIEFLKVPQSNMMDESFLQTGQYLSIPFILGGVLLYIYGGWNEKKGSAAFSL